MDQGQENSSKWVSFKSHKDKPIAFSSKRKLFWAAILVSIISPISGLILAMAFYPEPELKNQARFLILFSVSWGFFFYYRQIINLQYYWLF